MLIPTQRAIDSTEKHLDVFGKFFIEQISISLISLRATLKRSPSGTAHLTLNPLLAVFNVLTTALINIDDAPINFKLLYKVHFFSGPAELGRKVRRHGPKRRGSRLRFSGHRGTHECTQGIACCRMICTCLKLTGLSSP